MELPLHSHQHQPPSLPPPFCTHHQLRSTHLMIDFYFGFHKCHMVREGVTKTLPTMLAWWILASRKKDYFKVQKKQSIQVGADPLTRSQVSPPCMHAAAMQCTGDRVCTACTPTNLRRTKITALQSFIIKIASEKRKRCDVLARL